MNRTLSPIPAFWRIAPWEFLLPVLLLAAPNTLIATNAPPAPQLQVVDSRTAAKLLIHVEKPDYPPIARVNFIRGSVKLKVEVTSKGQVSQVHVLEGEPILAVAALNSVRKWLYRPYVLKEVPVPFGSFVIVKFDLHAHPPKGHLPDGADDYLEKQVHPPEVISKPRQDPSAADIQMKVLVGYNGEVVDATAIKAREEEIALARKCLQSWKFKPAQWGTLAVPWYLTVIVPLPYAALSQVANSAKH